MTDAMTEKRGSTAHCTCSYAKACLFEIIVWLSYGMELESERGREIARERERGREEI